MTKHPFMMMTFMVVACLSFVHPTYGLQTWLGPDGNPVFNPGGGGPVTPIVSYNFQSGILKVDTLGLNRLIDTATGSLIGGDDVGFHSLVLPSPEPLSLDLTGLRGTNGFGTIWEAVYFNGKTQMLGRQILDEYLLPIGVTQIATFSPGLTPSDFGQVEMGINFAVGQAGWTIFGPLEFVPEPAAISILTAALLGLIGWVRGACRYDGC